MTVLDDLLAVAAFALVVVHELVAVFVTRCVERIHQPHFILPLTWVRTPMYSEGYTAENRDVSDCWPCGSTDVDSQNR